MQDIIYDVAVSIDGFIAGPGRDISRFPHSSAIVEDYLARLNGYELVVMGGETYRFGLDHGLEPGANPYPGARVIVCSRSLKPPAGSAVEIWREVDRDAITALREQAGGPIYLCGGGAFAGWMLGQGQIQRLRLKRPPILLGGGTPLFAGSCPGPILRHIATTDYGDGGLFQEYAVAS